MKGILIILAIAVLCPMYSAGAAAAELQLDKDVLYQDRESNASITDRYGISVFSDETNKKIKENAEAEKQKNEQLKADIFKSDSLGITSGSDVVRQQTEEMGLFSQADPDTYNEGTDHGSSTGAAKAAGIIAVALVFLFTYIFAARYFKRTRRRETKNVYDTDDQDKGWE